MRAVFVDLPDWLRNEIHQRALDRHEEMWEGELHVNPPPDHHHTRMATRLARVLGPVTDALGMDCIVEAGLFDPDVPTMTSYRQPDVLVAPVANASHRGVEGVATLVVEIRSPWDEALEKLPFYGRVGVAHVLIVDRHPIRLALFGGDAPEPPDGDGWLVVNELGVGFRADDDAIEVRLPDGVIHRVTGEANNRP